MHSRRDAVQQLLIGAAVLLTMTLPLEHNIYALGDSNTCFAWPCYTWSWPTVLQHDLEASHPGWQVFNCGLPGMTAFRYQGSDGHDQVSGFTGEPMHGQYHLRKLLAQSNLAQQCRDLLYPSAAPKIVLSLGTNDLGRRTPFVIADTLLALKAEAEAAAPCVKVYIATIPNQQRAGPAVNDKVRFLNVSLRARLPADRLVDFSEGFPVDLFLPDGIHLNQAGHALRMERVRSALFRPS